MYKITNKKYNPFSNWEKVFSLLPSSYVRKGTLQIFHKIKRNYPQDYILCIGYNNRDTQFAITETFKTYETSVEQVIDRCLQEECSMERIKTSSSLESLSFIYNEKYATIHCVPMRISMDNMRPCPPLLDSSDIDIDDDKTRKLVLILHGPIHVIQNLFSNFYSSEQDITHLVAVPVEKVSHIFPKLFPMSLYPNIPKTTFLPPIQATSH